MAKETLRKCRYPSYYCPYCGMQQTFKVPREPQDLLRLKCGRCEGTFLVGDKAQGEVSKNGDNSQDNTA